VSSPTITLFLPSLEGGGAQRVFVELANEFVALGLRVNLALASAHGPYLEEICTGVRVIDFGASGVLQSLPKLARHLRSERPDVMLSGLDHANIIAMLARVAAGKGTRCVISMRSVPTAVYRESRSVRGWLLLQLIKVAYPFADAIVANSEAVASDLLQLLRITRSRLHIVYNPLNTSWIEKSSREEVDHAWCAPGAPPIVLGVGSLGVLKDFPTLIRAFSIVRSIHDCRLVILGEGAQREELEGLIHELGLERDVYLAGFVGNPFAWMRRARVFASSSLTEGCPNALMQALACGTSVISTDCVGGSAEILQHGKWGRLIAVGDYRAMADAIAKTLEATTQPDVRQRANDFAHDRIARQYLRILLPNHVPPAAERRP
jgi:glycosyltransferase involved in cell wall biosynthesis